MSAPNHSRTAAVSRRHLPILRLLGALFAILLTVGLGGAPAGGPQAGPGKDPGGRGAEERTLKLNRYRFDPLTGTPSLPRGLKLDQASATVAGYHLVQLEGKITPERRSGLEATGAIVLHYVQGNAFIVRADASALRQMERLPGVRWTGPFEPAYKLSPTLDVSQDEAANRAADRDRGEAAPPEKRIDSRERIAVLILAMEGSRVGEIVSAVKRAGGTGLRGGESGSRVVRAEIPRAALESLAREPGVLWIEREAPAFVMNDVARWVIQSNDAVNHSAPIHQHQIGGTGQVVTLADSGIDLEDDAFSDPAHSSAGPDHRKVTADYIPPGAFGDSRDNGDIRHGTHTSGSVAGDDGVWGVYEGDGVDSGNANLEKFEIHDGQAFTAKIQMQDISDDPDGKAVYPPSDVTVLFQEALNRGSWIHSNSWGTTFFNDYGPWAQSEDDFIWNNPDFTILFAAGNAGPGLYSLNTFATAKNVIAVGASGNGPLANNLAVVGSGVGTRYFSSRGPVPDGRIKPDVLAPGQGIWSAAGCHQGQICSGNHCTIGLICDDTYKALSGTSMATPTVAGAAALVRQYFSDGWYPTGSPHVGDARTPSSALIKAMLINSGAEMTGQDAYGNKELRYPNDNQGWGRILLEDAMHFACDGRDLVVDDHRAGLATGESQSYTFASAGSARPLEITLVWSDSPGIPNTTPNLVNDLDLEVTAPDGVTLYRGGRFTGYNPGESEPNPAAGPDRLNNVEGVRLVKRAQAGVWTVTVRGASVPMGRSDLGYRQPYALVITGLQAGPHGVIELDATRYRASSSVRITVVDTDLNLDPAAAERVVIPVTSTTEPAGEMVALDETGPDTATFVGTLLLDGVGAPASGDGRLQVRNRDPITAAYQDANGGPCGGGVSTAQARIDEDPPVVSAVTVSNLRPDRATITWTTDEPADTVVRFGRTAPPATTATGVNGVLQHSVSIRGLLPGVTYLFEVDSSDDLGNRAVDNRGGAYYTFTTLPLPTGARDIEWPTYQNNASRQGASGAFFLPPLTEQWYVNPDLGLLSDKGPILANGILYSVFRTGTVRAQDPSNPSSIFWETPVGLPGSILRSPAVADGLLFIVGQADFDGAKVYALDAFTGEVRWSFPSYPGLGWSPNDTAAVSGGRVFLGTIDQDVVALNASNGSIAWRYHSPNSFPNYGRVVGGGRVYLTSTAGEVSAVDEATGSLIWSRMTESETGCSRPDNIPLYAQETVYVGTGVECNGPGVMLALDAATGATRWQVPLVGQVLDSTPAYDGSAIYFGTTNPLGGEGNAYYALDATNGEILWQLLVPKPTRSPVVFVNGYVYALGADGYLRALDASTGSIVSSVRLNTWDDQGTNYLAVGDGWIFAEDANGGQYGFTGADDPDHDNDGVPDIADCRPLDPNVFPGATEICNGIDDNCNGFVDEGFPNSDGDAQADCVDPDDDNDGDPDVTDCAPLNPSVGHGLVEFCDGLDNDCDGAVDEGFPDFDGDGIKDCVDLDADNDGVTRPADCNDLDPTIPAPEDITNLPACWDGRDNDCDNVIDLDCAVDATAYLAQLQTQVSGSLGSLAATSANNVYQTLTEGGASGAKRMRVLYTFPAVNNLHYLLYFEGFKTNTTETFNFSYASSGLCGTGEIYTSTLMSVVKIGSDNNTLQSTDVGTVSPTAPKLCIKIEDAAGDSQADSVSIDRLYLMPADTVNCTDADRDGYTPSCGSCFNQFCPVIDCDDSDAARNPGQVEGPPGNPTCSDGKDNDCNGLVDGNDREHCLVPPPDVTASGETTATGTRTGDWTLTLTSNDQRESLKEASVNGKSKLVHTWTFDNVPAGSAHKLHFEGQRLDAGDDNFVLYFSTDNVNFTLIPGGTVTQAFVDQTMDLPFGTGALSGRIYIQVRDSDPTNAGKNLDTLLVDHLAIKTVP